MVKGLQNKQTENSNYRMMVILEIVGAAVDIPEALWLNSFEQDCGDGGDGCMTI